MKSLNSHWKPVCVLSAWRGGISTRLLHSSYSSVRVIQWKTQRSCNHSFQCTAFPFYSIVTFVISSAIRFQSGYRRGFQDSKSSSMPIQFKLLITNLYDLFYILVDLFLFITSVGDILNYVVSYADKLLDCSIAHFKLRTYKLIFILFNDTVAVTNYLKC